MNRWNQSNTSRINQTQDESHHNRSGSIMSRPNRWNNVTNTEYISHNTATGQMHDMLFKQIMNRWNQSNTSRINQTQIESNHSRSDSIMSRPNRWNNVTTTEYISHNTTTGQMHDILFKQIMNRWNQSNTSRINQTQVESHHNRWNRSYPCQKDGLPILSLSIYHITQQQVKCMIC